MTAHSSIHAAILWQIVLFAVEHDKYYSQMANIREAGKWKGLECTGTNIFSLTKLQWQSFEYGNLLLCKLGYI